MSLALLGLAIACGALLRLVVNDQPFSSSDHAELAALVTFFYPRNLGALGLSSSSTWNLLLNGHGELPPLIGIVSSTLLGLAGVRLNEFWWNLPFALISLLSVPLAERLATRLAGRTAGLIAAFLIAVLPIHAALSRASGLSHIPLMCVCQLLTILCFVAYFEQPTPQRARLAALALALNLLVELFFPMLLALLFGVGLLTVKADQRGEHMGLPQERRSALPNPRRSRDSRRLEDAIRKRSSCPSCPSWIRKTEFLTGALGMRVQRTRALLSRPRAMLLPFAVLCFNATLMLAYSAGWVSYGGLAARLLEGSDRKAGLYLGAFWGNASFVVGAPALVILGLLAVASLPALRRLEARAVPLLWAIVYLAPFVAFTRPNVYGYLLLGAVPLSLNAAIVLGRWWDGRGVRRGLAGALVALLLGLFTLRAVSMIFGLDPLALAGTGRAQGAVVPDQGLKAAAWWIRSRTPPDALIFADSAYEPYQLVYYLHRPFLAVTDAQQPEEAYRLLDAEQRQPAFYLVLPGDKELLRAHARGSPRQLATVMVDRRPALLIYGYAADEPQEIDAGAANRQFDTQFGTWRAMFAIGTRE